jgi:hypothetical protein
MNLREQLLKEHSKTNCTIIVNWVGDSQQRFDELFKIFLTDEYRVVQLAAWPVSYCVEAHPGLIKKHLGRLLDNLEKPGIHDAVKRNSIRLLQAIEIPPKYQGRVMNSCFEYISSPAEKAAVKAFALTVLDNLSRQFPEIIPELKTIIQDRWDQETPAFQSRARKIMKSFERG